MMLRHHLPSHWITPGTEGTRDVGEGRGKQLVICTNQGGAPDDTGGGRVPSPST